MAKVRVRYLGASDYRMIRAADLKNQFGIDLKLANPAPQFHRDAAPFDVGPDDLLWKRGSAIVIDASDDLLAVFQGEETMQVSEVKDDDSTGDLLFDATKYDDTGGTVTDRRTGQTEKT
jgi:hypothetical protein